MKGAEGDEENRPIVRLENFRKSWGTTFDHKAGVEAAVPSRNLKLRAREDTRLYTLTIFVEVT